MIAEETAKPTAGQGLAKATAKTVVAYVYLHLLVLIVLMVVLYLGICFNSSLETDQMDPTPTGSENEVRMNVNSGSALFYFSLINFYEVTPALLPIRSYTCEDIQFTATENVSTYRCQLPNNARIVATIEKYPIVMHFGAWLTIET